MKYLMQQPKLRDVLFFAISALFLLIANVAIGAETTLRTDVEVTGSIVTLGDLVDQAGHLASKPMFRAPDPGTTGTLDTRELLANLEREGLFGVIALSPTVTISRPGRQLTEDDVLKTIARRIKSSYNLDGEVEDIQVQLQKGVSGFMVAADLKDAPINSLTYNRDTGRFQARLSLPGSEQYIPLNGIAKLTVEVPVPLRAIQNGDIVDQSDFRKERFAKNEVNPNVLTDISRIVGLSARRPLLTGRPVAASDFQKPVYVERNQTILMSVKAPGLSLAMKGKSLGTGSMGDVITVQNLNTKRTAQAMITGPQQVEIISEPLSLTPRPFRSAEIVR